MMGPRGESRRRLRRTAPAIGTLVSMEVACGPAPDEAHAAGDALTRAFDWFQQIETSCSRFDATSELRRLTARIGQAVPATPLLLQAVRFALDVAESSGGAFDPTLGVPLEAAGFDRHYATGQDVRSGVPHVADVTYRDVSVDLDLGTITLHRPLVLDLGAVLKGLAVDMAVRELQPFTDFAIDAGGDMYLGGRSASGQPWRVGVRHPRRLHELIGVLVLTDCAVCTSGDYERRSPDGRGHHILDPRSRRPATEVASVTVVAPTSMAADAMATATFVLGPALGLPWLERHGAEGVIVTPTLERSITKGLHGRFTAGPPSTSVTTRGGSSILQDS